MREVNKLVARKRYATKKHSLAHLKGFRKSLLSVHSQTFTKMALILAITITILGGMLNVTWPERKSAIGTSSRFSRSQRLPETFWRENVSIHIYYHPRTSGLPAYIILIHIPQILNLIIILRYSMSLYIYIYIMFTVHGYPATGQHTPRLF